MFDACALGTTRPPLPHHIVASPYRKDYDAVPDNHPEDWSRRFAVDQARFIAAFSGAQRVGGAVLIVDPSDVARLGGQRGFALLWDLRVALEVRGRQATEFSEAHGDNASGHGFFVETLSSGDKINYTYTLTGVSKDGKPVSGSNKWTAVGGTGKFKGATGSGSCKGTGNPDGSANYDCTGNITVGGK